MAKKAATKHTTNTLIIDLPAELEAQRASHGLSAEELACQVGCEALDIRLVESGNGRFEIMSRMMDRLKVDLTGIAKGIFLHERLRDTRSRKKPSLADLADVTGIAETSLADLERGVGRVDHFLQVLAKLAPKAGIRGKGSAAGEKDTRFTSKALLTSVCLVFGGIDWDTCGHSGSHLCDVDGNYLERGGDGLRDIWGGTVVWMNPPFSGLSIWTAKFLAESLANPHKIHIALIPAVTESPFFRSAADHGGHIFLFSGRTKFERPDGTTQSSNRGMALVVFGAVNDTQLRRFEALEKGFWWVRKFAQPGVPADGFAKGADGTAKVRRNKNSPTSCPNSSALAHSEENSSSKADQVPCPVMAELEAAFRSPHGLRKGAEHYGRLCQTDPDDLLSIAIERALRRPRWENGVRERIESILSSLASTINRARSRAKLRGVDLVSLGDGVIVDRQFPCHRDLVETSEVEARRAGSEKALMLIAGGDPILSALIDQIGQGNRGRSIQQKLEIDTVQLATKRRCLKRRTQALCAGLSSGGRIDGRRLAELSV